MVDSVMAHQTPSTPYLDANNAARGIRNPFPNTPRTIDKTVRCAPMHPPSKHASTAQKGKHQATALK